MNEKIQKATPIIMMDGFGAKEIQKLTQVTKDMTVSYFKKPKEEGLTDWLGAELKKYVPGNIIGSIVEDIENGIDEFNQNLTELNEYVESGKQKETWLRKKLREPIANMDIKAQGEYLTQARDALAAGNMALATAIETDRGVMINTDAILEDAPETNLNDKITWDKQTLGMVASDIANQVNLSAAELAAAPSGALLALDAVKNIESINQETENIADMEIGSTLDKGLKTVAAAALTVCSVTGRVPILRNVATPILTNIACVGVESVKAFASFGQGKISANKAINHIEKAVTAGAVGLIRKGTNLAKSFLSKIPIIGPTIGTAVASVAGKIAEKKVGDYIHQGVEKIKPVARAVMETAKTVLTKTVDTVKSVGKKVLSFFGI